MTVNNLNNCGLTIPVVLLAIYQGDVPKKEQGLLQEVQLERQLMQIQEPLFLFFWTGCFLRLVACRFAAVFFTPHSPAMLVL